MLGNAQEATIKTLVALTALLGLPTLAMGAPSRPGDPALVLSNVTVVDVKVGRLLPGRTVAIEGGRIAAIRSYRAGQGLGQGQQIDATGKFLIPGLWDMHVHLAFGDWFPGARDITLPLFIANGVTGVRDMGSDLAPVLAWRKEIDAVALVGPRILTSGPMLDGPKPRFPSSLAVATPADGRQAVRDLKEQGADFIKLQSLIPREAVFAIADEARRRRIVVAGHVPDAVRAREMSAAGLKSFEHLIGVFEGSSPDETAFLTGPKSIGRFLASYDPARAGALFKLLARNRTWQCPTLVWERGGLLLDDRDLVHDPLRKYAPASWTGQAWRRFTDEIIKGYTDDLATRRRFFARELEVVGELRRAGVRFLAGTDTPPGVLVMPGFSLHDELELFVQAGFTPREALETATLNPATYLGLGSQLGAVETGKQADLVLLDANPLESIGNTRRIAAVIARGRYLPRGELDRILSQVEAVVARP
jgi:imidazolonepropionase-like amidohydrolase